MGNSIIKLLMIFFQ